MIQRKLFGFRLGDACKLAGLALCVLSDPIECPDLSAGSSPKCGWAESRDWDIGPGFLPSAFCLREWRPERQLPSCVAKGFQMEPRARQTAGSYAQMRYRSICAAGISSESRHVCESSLTWPGVYAPDAGGAERSAGSGRYVPRPITPETRRRGNRDSSD